ncbi:UPF0149 family protein [Thalassolituus sp. UBA2009]|jgi:uncharacterized protein YgfB (UPF0149 family)|uniref:UPF0149 family protein n=1 Tax=Thalassolituus sp. UBA2009 TaxID=1947658 RepID=UPI002579D39A|nr:UPF0149 family protein [Thalassolituus sp. UBA2009]
MTIEFSAAADLWLESRCYQTPSALHGWLTGYLASGARLKAADWLLEAQEYLELEETPEAPLQTFLQTFYDDVLLGLSGESMEFSVLLPADEDADIDEQVECLAQWSKGFLDGFGASGQIQGKVPEDVLEVLQDLDAFSQASLDDPQDPQNEMLYLELAEHARVAALTVFYGMNKTAPAPKTLH